VYASSVCMQVQCVCKFSVTAMFSTSAKSSRSTSGKLQILKFLALPPRRSIGLGVILRVYTPTPL